MSDNIDDLYPLSPLQGGMLFHALAEPGQGLYFNQLVCELRGRLDLGAFTQAWQGTLDAHAVLRTALVWDDVEEPVQVVLHEVELPLRTEDWRDLSPEASDARLAAFLEQDRRQGFDLSVPPLVRLTLLRTANEAHWLVFSHSHLVLDGWSVPLVLRDVFALYEGTLSGRVPRLASPRPYRDYIGWLSERDLAVTESFFRRELAGFHEPTSPGGAPGQGEGTGRATRVAHLPEDTTSALQGFARRHGLTLSTLVQGAWALVLSHLSGNEDVVFGTTVSGRPPDLAGVEEMVGLFINTQPVRVRVSPGVSWVDWLRRIQEAQLEARQHEHAPLVKVQRWSDVPPGTALFDTLVVFENYPLDAALTSASRALEVRDVRPMEADHHALTLISTNGARVPLHLRYDRTRFTQSFADEQLERLCRILQAIAARPEGRLGALPLLSEAERHRLLVAWNDTRTDFPSDTTVHALFEEQARRTPEALAVRMGEERLTFAELDSRANQLAHHLMGLGVRRGTWVGLCFRRSPDMVVALWAVLKAGAAYVPIDPAWPASRIAFLLEDTGVPVLLTEEALADELPVTSQFLFCLDSDWDRTAGREPVTPPASSCTADDLAYLIYTSGSTGRPKGVMVEHRGVVNYLWWALRAYAISEGHGSPVHSPLSFDLTVTALIAPLVAGRPVHLVSEDAGVEGLGEALRAEGHFSLVKLTPTHLRMLAQQLRPEEAAGRTRAFVIGGEALTAEMVAFWREHAPDTRLINEYGPTETVVGCCVYTVGETDPRKGPIAIGRPIANTRLYVLDPWLQPVAVGVPGELFIGGTGVARGYWRRPDLTAERFIPDAFGDEPGARLYRTGDRVRWRQDGRLEYLGRTDFQVKVRGYRIELGEIETALQAHAGVKEAVALVREDAPTPRIIAYVVPVSPGLDPKDLKAHLQQSLPEYMVPAAFVILAALPLSANGKVDRRALPSPEQATTEPTDTHVAPRDAKEEALAAIWAQVLGRERVSVSDDFFELGGDSILGIQIIARAAQAGLHLNAKQLFDHPTIERLAAVAAEAPVVLAEQGLVTGPVPLTPIQGWFFERDLPAPHHFNQALRLTLRERIIPEHLERALQHLREHHDTLRLRFTRDAEGRWHQELGDLKGNFPLEQVDASDLEAPAARAQVSLNLGTGPIARAVLFERGPDTPQELVLVIHHLAVDAVSWRVLLEDLLTAYRQARGNEPLRLPPKTLSYAAWATRLVEHAATDAAREETQYWLHRPWASAGRLPLDLDGGVVEANTEGAASLVEASLSPEETQSLLQDVAKHCRARPDELLLGALARTLRRWTGAACIQVEMEGHGREDLFDGVDLSRTVGWFTSLYPVFVELTDEGPAAGLRAAKDALRAVPARGVGYGVLRYLSPDPAVRERLANPPSSEVGFNYLGQFDHVLPDTAPLALSNGPVGPTRASGGRRAHVLDVDCAVTGGRLRLMLTYGTALHRRDTVERLAAGMLTALRELISLGMAGDARGLVPSDFPLAGLSRSSLDGLADRLAASGLGLRDVEDLYPLSPLQQGILFHHLQEDGSQPYFNQITFELDGALEVDLFTRAWRQVVASHPILRTAFFWEGLEAPLQAVMRDVEPPVLQEDWRSVAAADREARLATFFAADRRQGVTLNRAPLFRLTLLRLGERLWRVVFSLSHLLLDGWSVPLVMRDVLTRYEALRRGLTPPRRDARPYRDFIAWLGRGDPSAERTFWSASLKGFTEPTHLELGGVFPSAGTQVGRREHPLRLSGEDTTSLFAFAREQGLTPGTIIQAAWALLLARYTGRDDVLFGLTVSGRPAALPGVESMVGMFINAIPVRVRLPAAQSVGAWLKALQAWLMEAREHEHAPLVDVRRWSDMPPGPALFESLVIYENYPVDTALTAPSDELVVRDARSLEVDHHPLTLTAMPGRQLLLQLAYDATRFEASAIEALMTHLSQVLRGFRATVDRPLSSVSLLSDAERHRLLVEWNATRTEYPRGTTLPEVFSQVVARHPDKVAVEFGDQKLTYTQLDARANQLAWHLRELGVTTDSRVAIALERSLELVIALVGILKAGGAYVPLDPSYPVERLRAMMEDATPRVLLTTRELSARLPGESLKVVVWEEAPLTERPTSTPPSAALPESLAYIDFTSGSTGRPKGVGTPQEAVLRTLFGVDFANLGPEETFLLIAPVSFDASTLELWGPLLHGGRLVVFPPHTPSDAHELESVLVEHGVTTLHLTAGLFTQVVDAHLQGLRTVKQLLTGGDVVSAPHVRQVLETLRIPVTACYGPTETTMFASCHRMTRPEHAGSVVPIGRPIGNTQVYVLDGQGQPVPVGVTGELFIGGEGVARGYVEQPALTAERFVPDAFSEKRGARLYRTGDLARWRSDGVLEFLGRSDAQVKVSGYRIELAEIEGALTKHPEVAEAVVVVREDRVGDKRLIAYCVPKTPRPVGEGQGEGAVALRSHLEAHLPAYMVPAAFLYLERIPLTAAGKVDRKALPAPDFANAAEANFSEPRTMTEQVLASIFGEVLGLSRVGARSHFFEQGGHSLLATRAISKVRAAFGIDLPLRELFEAPTVSALAERVDRHIRERASAVAPPLERRSDPSVPPPLSFAQQRLWFLDQLDPGSASYNVPAAVRLTGPLDVEALKRSFETLVQRHESLRTTFRAEDGAPVQVIAPSPAIGFRVLDLQSLPETERDAEARRHVDQEGRSPFDLENGPLFRTLLLKLAAQDHVLVMNLHHIVSDGWSTGVLVREVSALYDAYAQGKPSPLGELRVQYADYAQWQRGWLKGEVLESQLDYWRKQLEGTPKALEFPTDRARPARQSNRGSYQQEVWPKELWRGVEGLARKEGATAFMVLLSAYQVVLTRYAGQEDVSVGAPIAGRTHEEVEGLIGYFANTLVLRTKVTPEKSFRELLKQVREVTLGAYAHQDVPFEKLVEELQPERDLSRSPLFQVTLTLQNTPEVEVRLGGGLRLRGLETENETSKFDFSLLVGEVEEGVSAALNYNSDLFEEETAKRVLRQVRVVLEEAVARPETKVGRLPLMREEERRRLLQEWSGRSREYPREKSLAELFEEQAARAPDAVAVECGEQRVSYGELNGRANQLAHHLRGMGVGPEVRVGLCVERAVEWVVGALGILKAGGAYVPLDASQPLERLRWMKSEAAVAVLVAREELAEQVAEGSEVVVAVDTDWPVIARQSTRNPQARTGGEHLAYVMFTSGSTGKPKGVAVPQKAVTRLVKETDYASFSAEEVWLQLAPVSFDASTLEVWGALLNGGKLVVYPEGPLSLEELGRALEEKAITSLWLTAALYEQMQGQQGKALGKVRQVLAGGDVLPVQRVKERLEEGKRLLNGYGPTEGTTFTSVHRMEKVEDLGKGTVPIGRPIANTKVYVLGEGMEEVAEGVPGELYVGGEGLARGYVNQPGLTAERFVPSPYGRGERLYRTGDEVRWREGGVLEYLGRKDTQVKVRGYRIELGEVEEALRQKEGVREAAVVVREDVAGDKRLVAYVVTESEAGTLKEHLKKKLPEYMVPSAYVVLEELPKTTSGKLDRKALPASEATSDSKPPRQPPRTDTELELAKLFTQVLGARSLNRDDDFFELGGHSLLATQLIAHIRTTFGVEFPLRALFEAPTLEAIALRIETARQSGTMLEAPPLVPVPRTEALPLSFAQQRLWFIDQLEPGSATYNIPITLHIEGVLSEEALLRAFSALVARHESLRTTFTSREGQPVQVIRPPEALPLAYEDLSLLPEPERLTEARRRAAREALRPFSLEHGPLLRIRLLRLSYQEHVLVLVMHHIVSDGWSMGVLVREMGALYASFTEGRLSPLPELPVQYADYAAWQRQWLSGPVLDAQRDWWKQRLEGAPPYLDLPTDKPRPAVLSSRGGEVRVHLPRSLGDSLKVLAQREGATPFMVLLAGFQVLLARYAGQEDVLVGSPIAGRRYAETEGLIGFFVNTLVLRAQVRPEFTFQELLTRVRESTLGAYEHQDLPFEKLVEDLQPARDLSRSPLFQVLFVLQNAPVEALSLPALTLKPLAVEGAEATKFELTLNLGETSEGFEGTLRYGTDLFTEATAKRLARWYQSLLESIISDPSQRIDRLTWLTEAERHQVLSGWNETAVDFPAVTGVHRLFELQAARTPDAPAVRCEEQELTFRQLDARANQLAHHLRSLGVGPDLPVALCLERGVEWVVSMLGVLKAGGAYAPLEPSQPAARLRTLVEELSAPVVVTEARHADRFSGVPARRVVVDEDVARIASQRSDAPRVDLEPGHLAYVLFTSGSTGRPKGVAVPHAGLLNYTQAAIERLGLRDCSSFALVSTFAADLGNTVLFPALCTGGLLHVLTRERAANPAGVAEYFQRHRVDCLKLVPSHLMALLTAADPRQVLPRKKLVLGGESSSRAMLDQVRALAPECEVFNHYGPTETTVGVLAGRLSEEPDAAVPLGKALANTRLYVLDEHLQPQPVGLPGELYLGGAQVTRGYVARPELTAERYLPDPYSPIAGARMYRTGDRVRWREDGRVELLGRVDFQIKLRGFRIEPGEIEAVLRQHPDVREAVVMAREDTIGDKRLIAYVVTTPRPAGEGRGEGLRTTLRSHLEAHLPAYMVPTAFQLLERMPLNANGKVDRKALPPPDAAPREEASASEPPRTPLEETLAAIWEQVLRREKVGRKDDFFALGGHSLLATQVVARIRASLQVELPLRALFEAPTLSALAQRLERETKRVDRPALQKVPRTGPVPLSFAQQRLWFLDRLQPGSTAYNMPSALILEGALDVSALEAAFTEVVRRHESLRTTFTEIEGAARQVIAPAKPFHLSRQDVSERSEREEATRQLARDVVSTSFDLSQGPLLRALLIRRAEHEHVLVMNLHHIVSDGWSTGVLVREVSALYDAYAQGKPSPLGELRVQYADYAQWQRGWLKGEVLQGQLDYWRKQLEGTPKALEFPTDRARPARQSNRGSYQQEVWPKELWRGVEGLARKEGATAFMVLLSAYQVVLARYAGQEDVSVGAPIAGRTHEEVEGLIGYFANTLVLRTRVGREQSFRELLKQVREVTLGAYAHQDVPFEKLVEELQPERDLSRSPLFQVTLTLQNTPEVEVRLGGGLRLRGLETENETSKFDFSLLVGEVEEGVSAALNHNSDLFEEETAKRVLRQVRVVLEEAVARPETKVGRLPLMREEEKRRLLREWSGRSREYPREKSLAELFEEQAARAPDAVAVECGEQRVSYGELNGRANQLAHHLRGMGVGPEVRVGLCVERSVEWVVGALGILKAGGAYVPLDASQPLERLRWMKSEAAVAVLVAREELAEQVAEGSEVVVAVDTDWPVIARQSTHNPRARTGGEHLAYVMFTSGSTGKPKGVAVPQKAVTRLVKETDYASFSAEEVWLQLAPVSFDASTLEVWGALLNGGKLVVYPEGPLSLEELGRALEEKAITSLWLTAALYEQMQGQQGKALGKVRQVLAGGDVLPVQRVKERLEEGKRLLNGYGPTEGTTFTSVHRMEKVEDVGKGTVPIGRPIANTKVYVLGEGMEEVAEGVPGELYVGGEGLARGYVNQPGLTAERFVPSPYGRGERLYRTGDEVRWREGGVLEYLGRKDTQVKVRGYRIELGEVEEALRQKEGVREAAVVVREDVAGDKRLVAYVVTESEAGALKEHLKKKLPEYMVPSGYVVLEELPKTTSGKLDRKALPAPESIQHPNHQHQEPRTDTEQTLARIFADVLGVPRVSLDDDFFELGGHSLLATQVVAKVRSTLGKDLALRAIFEAPSVERLAAWLDQETTPEAPDRHCITLQSEGTGTPLFLVHAVGGAVGPYRELARRLGPSRPVLGLQAAGLDGREPPLERIEDLARRYVASMRAVRPEGPYLLGGWSLGGVIAFEMARELERQGQPVALLALFDSFAPTDESTPEAPDDALLLAGLALDLSRLAGRDSALRPDQLTGLSEAEQLATVARLGREEGWLPPGLGDAELRGWRDVARANLRALAAYRPGPYAGRVLLLRAADAKRVAPPSPAHGWEHWVTPSPRVEDVPGDHHGMLRPPHVEAWVKLLSHHLEIVADDSPKATRAG